MTRSLLSIDGNELTELELKVLTCSKQPPNRLGRSFLMGDVKRCSGFSPEARFSEIVPGGVCQSSAHSSEVKKICDGIASFLPTFNDSKFVVIKRDDVGGYGIVSQKTVGSDVITDEVIIKKVNNAWKPIIYTPTGRMEDAISQNVMEKVTERYGIEFNSMLDYANGRGHLPRNRRVYDEDEFGKTLHKLNSVGLVQVVDCENNEQCVKMSEKGYKVYYAFNRGKENDGLSDSEKSVRSSGGFGVKYYAPLVGVEKTSEGQRKLAIKEDALASVSSGLASALNIRDAGSHFTVDLPNGLLELTSAPWQGRTIKNAFDEIEKYEKGLSSLGYARPLGSTIDYESKVRRYYDNGTETDPDTSGGAHLTFVPPVTQFDGRYKPIWELFLLNFARLVQWWEPLVLGATGSPFKRVKNGAEEWYYTSKRQHQSDNLKMGASNIEKLVEGDGAIGILTGRETKWIRKDRDYLGTELSRDKPKGDLESTGIAWSGASEDNCENNFNNSSERAMCRAQTDQGIGLRFFEYEPIQLLEERANVIPLLMDRAYQLASQDIEVPQARENEGWNDFVWDVMTKGQDAWMGTTLTSSTDTALLFSSVLTGKKTTIPIPTKVIEGGKIVVDELWKNHYDDYFTKFFGVKRKPLHADSLSKNKEDLETRRRNHESYVEVRSSEYGRGSLP